MTQDIHGGKYFFFLKSRMSNWHMHPFVVNGVSFNCGEQAMMYEKAVMFGDKETASKIMAETDPAKMLALGREVRNYNNDLWAAFREEVVYEIAHARFSQCDYLREDLFATGDAILVEASPIDSIWGIGLDAETARATPDTDWPGKNLLGQILTRVRNELRAGKSYAPPTTR